MVTTNPVPVTNEIVVSYPLEKVKQAISLLLECYSPKYFVPEKNGVSHALGTYVFTRPKGVNTPTIRMTVQEVGSDKTKIIFNSSSSSFTVTAPELQTSISEVQNILLTVLKGVRNQELEAIIKSNNSGNGCFSCMQSIGCTIVLILIIIVLGTGVLSFLLALF